MRNVNLKTDKSSVVALIVMITIVSAILLLGVKVDAAEPKDVSACTCDLYDEFWTGEAVTPSPMVMYGETMLVENEDYVVSYLNNVDCGIATFRITGIGYYTGTKDFTFEIYKYVWYWWSYGSDSETFNAMTVSANVTPGIQSKLKYGYKVTDPGDPTCEGYTFDGWYFFPTGGEQGIRWDFENDVLTEEGTFVATWTKNPVILNGEDQKIDVTKTETATFRSDADVSTFVKVTVDGEDVDPKNYTVTEGSTIITFTSEFLKTLKSGTHTISIVSETGAATCSFSVVSASPDTGDIGLRTYVILAAVAGTIIGLLLCLMKDLADAKKKKIE